MPTQRVFFSGYVLRYMLLYVPLPTHLISHTQKLTIRGFAVRTATSMSSKCALPVVRFYIFKTQTIDIARCLKFRKPADLRTTMQDRCEALPELSSEMRCARSHIVSSTFSPERPSPHFLRCPLLTAANMVRHAWGHSPHNMRGMGSLFPFGQVPFRPVASISMTLAFFLTSHPNRKIFFTQSFEIYPIEAIANLFRENTTGIT